MNVKEVFEKAVNDGYNVQIGRCPEFPHGKSVTHINLKDEKDFRPSVTFYPPSDEHPYLRIIDEHGRETRCCRRDGKPTSITFFNGIIGPFHYNPGEWGLSTKTLMEIYNEMLRRNRE